MNEYCESFNWSNKLDALTYIIGGLEEIHEKKMVHRDFHTGNILFKSNFIFDNSVYISDMGLCGDVGNIDETKFYGIMPYVAPEVLRGKPYTQAADIYSFGMIMYFAATGKQPFSNCAHDHLLALDICNGIRPEINEPEAPKCYIDLMKKCWDPDPENRPSAIEVDNLITSFYESYSYKEGNDEIKKQFKEAEEFREANPSSINNSQSTTHPQAIFTSRLLDPYRPKYNNSECLDCKIND